MIQIFVLLLSVSILACRPAADFRPPTAEQIEKDSDLIIIGTVEKAVTRDFERVLSVKVEKTLKGKASGIVTVITGASSCDRLGYDAVPGTRCKFFIRDGKTFSGILGGNASTCPWKAGP